MNITKEYIDLCKNDKVQGLREITTDEQGVKWITFKNGDIKYYTTTEDYVIVDAKEKGSRTYRYMIMLWIPTGDDLDQCIVDICKRHNLDYQVGTTKKPNYWWWVTTTSRVGDPDENIIMVEAEKNPLIAKLKLLLSLLESEG